MNKIEIIGDEDKEINLAIYSLGLHQSVQIPGIKMWVTRVPGGWIYDDSDMNTSTFIKFNNEFDINSTFEL